MSRTQPDLHEPEEGFERAVEPVEIAPGVVLGGPAMPVIAGPCAVEGEDEVMAAAEAVKTIAEALGLPVVFKASYDKANRSAGGSFRSIGRVEALAVLGRVRSVTGMPILTDVHEPGHCESVAEVADILQIPAFLCRQTDLLVAAARTGRTVNIKKGQFMAPDDMAKAVEKVTTAGNDKVFVTERGFSFGYHNLVVDMRAIAQMQGDGIPVVFDVTHSLQLPGGGQETGGARRFAEPLARAAVAAGVDGLFVEIHPDPENALSDSTTQLPPARAHQLLESLLAIRLALEPWRRRAASESS